MLKLKVHGNTKEGVWLVEPKISVGSATANNLVIDDPKVDDVHIEIFVKGEELIIHRRSDANTLVNGKKLGVKARLEVDDEIVVGATKLEVIDPKIERAKKQATSHTDNTAVKPAHQWTLTAAQTGLARKVYEIQDGMVVGRAKDCDVVILLAHLSRRHAQFKMLGNNRLEVTDLNSSNGTFVNGKQITTTVLSHGDEVRFDTLSFKVTGPQDDIDKTMVRPMTSEELMGQLAESKPKVGSSNKAKPEQPAASSSTSMAAPEQKMSSPLPKIAVAAAIVIAIAVVAVFVL